MNADQTRIIEYLREKICQGHRFFKARHIADDLGLTPKIVGANMAWLKSCYSGLRIQRWAYSNSTTWLVTQV